MLLQFKTKNHKCFYDEIILDMTATQEKGHIESTIEVNSNNILPVVAVYGANASGKTGLLEALSYMVEIIRKSVFFDVTKPFPVFPFAFSKKALTENSDYEICLCLNGMEYRYGFSINKKGIDEEWLYVKKFSNDKRIKEKIIFERKNDNVYFSNTYKKYDKNWQFISKNYSLINNRILVLTSIALKEETGAFRDIYNYISNCININIDNYWQKEKSINILLNNNSLFNDFQKILNEFDPCLAGVKIEAANDLETNEKKYVISGIHSSLEDNKSILLPFIYESAGTIKIFNIVPSILYNLKNGGLLCIDELDTQLHPLLYRKIVNMYKNKEINKNNAQLIYTTHSTFLLNSKDSRRDQVYFVDKDKRGISQLYSLSDFRNLRLDADYEKRYLSGSFGAIPFDKE